MNRASHHFELRMIVRFDGGGAFAFQLANARFDGTFVDSDHVVMCVLDAECFREGADEVLLVHLRVALHRLVLFDAFGNVAQLGEGFMS